MKIRYANKGNWCVDCNSNVYEVSNKIDVRALGSTVGTCIVCGQAYFLTFPLNPKDTVIPDSRIKFKGWKRKK